jgi:hypothetical protein
VKFSGRGGPPFKPYKDEKLKSSLLMDKKIIY